MSDVLYLNSRRSGRHTLHFVLIRTVSYVFQDVTRLIDVMIFI